ncbi:MAG: hypothetical protein FD163_1011 [Hyphomonadaceae bacterium]|nr:MAG: hypothetical protein FD128_1986 [Hyphomonadaceae bacterium]KAF0186343.1 MAG: hypothetical protein FD163_1011 [Hyphomonadaceae bacterium]
MTARNYTIQNSSLARKHFKEIFNYSCDNWGEKTAENYMRSLVSGIAAVATGHEPPRINPEISDKYPYILVKNHNIFLEFSGDVLIVVAVLHTAMNANERLP